MAEERSFARSLSGAMQVWKVYWIPKQGRQLKMDGTECKRCKEPDTFDTFCDECAGLVLDRTNRLISRARLAKHGIDDVCKLMGIESLQALIDLEGEVTDAELLETFTNVTSTIPDGGKYKKFLLCMRLMRFEEEREGWLELAMMSNRIPFDDDYLQAEIEAAKWEPTDN